MAQKPIAERVAELVREPVGSLGLRLWDVKYVKEGASWYLRVYIDKDGTVDINDCTEVSHLLDPLLDEADMINSAYYFEVCSPGLERELTRAEHFAATVGMKVKVILIRPRDGVREFTGTLTGYDGAVHIVTDGGEAVFDKNEIAKVKRFDLE